MKTEPGYEPLAAILQEALDQAQLGKGKECHANGLPFLEQPIMAGGRECGPGGLVFQARKKILEALNCQDDERAIVDLLGAINYTAATVLLRREGMANKQGDCLKDLLRTTDFPKMPELIPAVERGINSMKDWEKWRYDITTGCAQSK